MDAQRQFTAELRQLKRELPERPWLFARLAGLLLSAGRRREALILLRRGTRDQPDYSSGWLVLADALDQEGEEREAATIREGLCQRVPGIHAAWLRRLQAARTDPERHLELLQRVWELDQFSAQRNLELEQAGLRRPAEYEQALRPTAAEAARREVQFRRLLDQHAHLEAVPSAAPPSEIEPAIEPLPPAEQANPTPEPAPERLTITTVESLPVPAPETEASPCEDEPAAQSVATPALPQESEDDVELEPEPPDENPPRRAGRDDVLREQADRLDSLTRPLHLPQGLPEDPTRRVAGRPRDLFDPRSMMTRRLARIYLEQGYPGLAVRVLDELARREPTAADLPALQDAARAEERRLAETPSPRTRRKT